MTQKVMNQIHCCRVLMVRDSSPDRVFWFTRTMEKPQKKLLKNLILKQAHLLNGTVRIGRLFAVTSLWRLLVPEVFMAMQILKPIQFGQLVGIINHYCLVFAIWENGLFSVCPKQVIAMMAPTDGIPSGPVSVILAHPKILTI